MSRPDRRGFTLVELLVVIGVIAVLIGLLLPLLRRARQSSQQVACASSMRQIGFALRTYAGENRDRLPWAWLQWSGGPGVGTLGTSFDDLLDPYLGRRLTEQERDAAVSPRDNRVFRCPADDVDRTPAAGEGFARTYAMICHVEVIPGTSTARPDGRGCRFEGSGGTMGWGGTFAQVPWPALSGSMSAKLGWFRDAAATLLLVEIPEPRNVQGSGEAVVVDTPLYQTVGWKPGWNSTKNGPERVITLHQTRWNYLFADGHVDLLRMEQTVRPAATYQAAIAETNYMWTRRTDD